MEVWDSKPLVGEIKMISRELVAGGMLKSLKKPQGREKNSVHSRLTLIKMPKSEKPDIVFSERDSRGIRQPHNDPLVTMLRVEEFNIHRVLIDNESSIDIIYLPAF